MYPTAISIGGSVLLGGQNEESRFKDFSLFFSDLRKTMPIAVVTGGGWIARYYINESKKSGMSKDFQDRMGILATRMNARMMGLVPPGSLDIPRTIEDGAKQFLDKGFAIMGGTTPGHTTDTVTAMLGEAIKAKKIVNITSVPGVYESDPKKNPGTRRYKTMNYEELEKVSGKIMNEPGVNIIFDLQGVEILKKNGMELIVLSGDDIENLRKALKGEAFEGTTVSVGGDVTFY